MFSAVNAWASGGSAPEEPVYDLNVAGELSYGQSKLITECLVDKATGMSGVQSACCRFGIVAGPVRLKRVCGTSMSIFNRYVFPTGS